ncbi:hypothetical protein FRB99_002761 [Tulasnella sp. 403]|nr:hypothetical protein FRB99_002761 [Tulasnella sp. 403]
MSGRPAYLLTRRLDPLLAVFTGVFAFYLSETNPRTAPPPGETLGELAKWKYDRWKAERDAKHESEDGSWEEVVRSIEKEKSS